MNYKTIIAEYKNNVCSIQINRPDANNSINDILIEECTRVLEQCDENMKIVVIKGLEDVFCLGADFNEIHADISKGNYSNQSPEPLYNLWLKLATGPYITIAYVRGKANAGGVGFVAACDMVIADETAQFGLSELLFGLYPACVLPFLIRKIGFQKAHYMTLMTKSISVSQANSWGLVDVYDKRSESLLQKHLLRLKCISKTAIIKYKRYVNSLNDILIKSKSLAVEANEEIFSDRDNINGIFRYVDEGKFPWEG
ncbi:enoyl-CoA hydratase/isomerase [Vallitalea guaymasensis]|uniref:enoyl-CoA hydratase/isomerase n=1 Tax=Vallitalea guaymasensis TaxID=1185412 RepID=UPI000DE43A39|nr:enoyl-CoA hydratase/isomerase [Vallitalea guaymasensis]